MRRLPGKDGLNMGKYKRLFVVVMDSLGVGAMEDSPEFGDVDVNTLGHISRSVDSFVIPNLQKMGMANLTPLKQVEPVENSLGYYGKLRERSKGKGHHDRTLGDDGA